MRNKNNFLSENDVYFSLEADFYIGFNVIIKLTKRILCDNYHIKF